MAALFPVKRKYASFQRRTYKIKVDSNPELYESSLETKELISNHQVFNEKHTIWGYYGDIFCKQGVSLIA